MKEMTQEIKKVILSLYYGQHILSYPQENTVYDNTQDCWVIKENPTLNLRKLTDLNQEEKIILWSIMHPIDDWQELVISKGIMSAEEVLKDSGFNECDEWLSNYGEGNFIKLDQIQTDYLRSIGVAVPYLHWSVDDLVGHGIFKFKTPPQNVK